MSRKPIDLTGQTFGRLTPLEIVDSTKSGVVWKCQCDCGETTNVKSGHLRSGNTRSCGCLAKEVSTETIRKLGAKHGGRESAPVEYRAWRHLREFHSCPPEWDDFVQFFVDVGERPSPEHELARKDGTKPHGKNNTYWRHHDDDRQLGSNDLGSGFCIDFRANSRSTATA
jgi:hypothetical protein